MLNVVVNIVALVECIWYCKDKRNISPSKKAIKMYRKVHEIFNVWEKLKNFEILPDILHSKTLSYLLHSDSEYFSYY